MNDLKTVFIISVVLIGVAIATPIATSIAPMVMDTVLVIILYAMAGIGILAIPVVLVLYCMDRHMSAPCNVPGTGSSSIVERLAQIKERNIRTEKSLKMSIATINSLHEAMLSSFVEEVTIGRVKGFRL